MRKFLLGMLLFGLCFAIHNIALSVEENYEKNIPPGLKVKVEKAYKFLGSSAQPEKVLDRKLIIHYSNQGKFVKREWYDGLGVFQGNINVKYDDRGNKIESAWTNPGDKITCRVQYKCDSNGRAIETQTFDDKNILTNNSFMKYDEMGNCTEMTIYAQDKIIGKDISKYNSNGKIIESRMQMPAYEIINSCKYDEKFNLIETVSRQSDKITPTSRSVLKYDSDNHVLELFVYGPGNELVNKTFYKYDKNGNEIEMLTQVIFDGAVEKAYKSYTKYDVKNNKTEVYSVKIEEKSGETKERPESLTTWEYEFYPANDKPADGK